MNGKIRRRIEMGSRALQFSQANPHPSPAYEIMVARLEDLMREACELERRQLKGRLQVHAAAEHKRELRRTMKLTHLAYVTRVATVASREEPELPQVFESPRGSRAQLAFRTTAGRIAAEALKRRDLLERYGLSAQALEALGRMLDDFDRAVEELLEGRLMHVGATAGLKQVVDEVLLAVSVLDGFNRIRFAGEVHDLAAWSSASKVLAHSPRATENEAPEDAAEEGGVRPAA